MAIFKNKTTAEQIYTSSIGYTFLRTAQGTKRYTKTRHAKNSSNFSAQLMCTVQIAKYMQLGWETHSDWSLRRYWRDYAAAGSQPILPHRGLLPLVLLQCSSCNECAYFQTSYSPAQTKHTTQILAMWTNSTQEKVNSDEKPGRCGPHSLIRQVHLEGNSDSKPSKQCVIRATPGIVAPGARLGHTPRICTASYQRNFWTRRLPLSLRFLAICTLSSAC